MCGLARTRLGSRTILSWDELVAKFRANASAVLSQQQVEKLTAMIRDLETLGDVAELMQLCRPGNAHGD